MKKRNLQTQLGVYLLAVVFTAGCASSAPPVEDTPPEAASSIENKAVEDKAVEDGPFDVAMDWARELTLGEVPPPEQVRQVVGEWSTASVARVWATGDEYRAVVVQKNTARETPAVLLHITRSDAGQWEVAGAEPTTSTHLWSEL